MGVTSTRQKTVNYKQDVEHLVSQTMTSFMTPCHHSLWLMILFEVSLRAVFVLVTTDFNLKQPVLVWAP